MSLLSAAVKARLPLIYVETDDPMNFTNVLLEMFGEVVPIPRGMLPTPPNKATKLVNEFAHPGALMWWHNPPDHTDWEKVYEAAIEKNQVVLVSGCEYHYTMFRAGYIAPPDSMVMDFITRYVEDEKTHPEVLNVFRGMSMKTIVEVTKLASVQFNEITATSLLKARRNTTNLADGLRWIAPTKDFYLAPKFLYGWKEKDGKFFTPTAPKILRPRGLLFDGPPGTGKTMAAKWISSRLGYPLFHLDVAAMMRKYHGESEQLFRKALDQLATLGPIVLLIDEVEKLFLTGDEDSGVTRRVLSMLLWWLQEHDLPVLTIMTTNEYKNIPPELIRPGRIDSTFLFQGLNTLALESFISAYAHFLENEVGETVFLPDDLILLSNQVSTKFLLNTGFVPQARVVQVVKDLAKQRLIDKGVKL